MARKFEDETEGDSERRPVFNGGEYLVGDSTKHEAFSALSLRESFLSLIQYPNENDNSEITTKDNDSK